MAIDKLIETVTEKVIDSENTMILCGMLFPYIGLNKRAVDMYAEELEKSNLSVEAKLYYLLNAKKELKQIKNNKYCFICFVVIRAYFLCRILKHDSE